MWIPFVVFLVLWMLSIKFYMPVAVTFFFFAAVLVVTAAALLEPRPTSRG